MQLGRRNKTDFGIIKIHNRVIGSVASLAAKEVKGVLAIAPSSPIKDLRDLFHKEDFVKGVNIQFGDNNNDVDISINLVIKYGSSVPYVSTMVQENIKKRVEELTGLIVNEVEVNVVDVS